MIPDVTGREVNGGSAVPDERGSVKVVEAGGKRN